MKLYITTLNEYGSPKEELPYLSFNLKVMKDIYEYILTQVQLNNMQSVQILRTKIESLFLHKCKLIEDIFIITASKSMSGFNLKTSFAYHILMISETIPTYCIYLYLANDISIKHSVLYTTAVSDALQAYHANAQYIDVLIYVKHANYLNIDTI